MYAYNTQLCEAIEHLRDEYNRRRASNERGDLVSGFSVKVFINPANFDEVRDYGYFEKFDGKYRTPAPDSLLRIIRTSLPDQNMEATGPMAFFDNDPQSDPCFNDATGEIDHFVGEFTSFGDSAGAGRFQTFEVPVIAGEETLLRLDWLDPLAQLRLFVRDPNDRFVVSDTSAAGSPKFLVIPAGVGGTYTVAVMVAEGSTAYTLQVNPFERLPQPSDYEFMSSGSESSGRWQVFRFDVLAGERITADLTWDDPTAFIKLFLRNETGSLITKDNDGSLPATVSAVAQSSGTWSIGVSIMSGDVNYNLTVDTE